MVGHPCPSDEIDLLQETLEAAHNVRLGRSVKECTWNAFKDADKLLDLSYLLTLHLTNIS